MTKAGKQILEAAQEAVRVARGEEPAARITIKGHAYVPEDDITEKWIPIKDAPLGVMGFVWQQAWRSPFPGKRINDMGMVWVDTCEMAAAGYETHADWWRPFMSTPDRDVNVPRSLR